MFKHIKERIQIFIWMYVKEDMIIELIAILLGAAIVSAVIIFIINMVNN